MVVVDRQGLERPIGDERFFSWPRVSPDGKRVAVEIGTGDGSFDVWLYDLASKGFSRLTNNFTGVRPLGWSADGRTVAYLAAEGTHSGNLGRMRVARVPWDLSAAPEILTPPVVLNPEDGSLGPAHTSLVVRRRGYNGPGDIEIAPLDTPTAFKPFVATNADEETPRISPNGKLVAYASDETGHYEVYLRPVAGGGGRIQVSAGGGSEPVWSLDGRGLYYRTPGRLMFATIATSPELNVAKRDSMFADPYHREGKAVQYDAFPNGDLLMLKRNERSELRPTIVTNWTRLLRTKNK
jgi:eukaryotic-like serine/threonine-protein kinase